MQPTTSAATTIMLTSAIVKATAERAEVLLGEVLLESVDVGASVVVDGVCVASAWLCLNDIQEYPLYQLSSEL